ncbi:MAG: polyprenyl synthetase family protein [Aggregatilineales bacterium]
MGLSNTVSADRYTALLEQLAARRERVYHYLFESDYAAQFRPAHIRDAALSYLKMGGKSLRPAVLLLSCGAVGGDETIALPAAAAIEVYHTWTLVHDDIIDRDSRRRNAPTVHVEFASRGARELGFSGPDAAHYGIAIGILAGDVQQSWSYMLFHELHRRYGVDAELVLRLVEELATRVQLLLVEGETLDIQFARRGIDDLTEPDVIDMLWKKTGVLYEFAGYAGASIGLGTVNAPLVEQIGAFCGQCGIAFQLQDDLLGVVGDESQIGKAVGADIREGKKTMIVYQALQNANETQRAELLSILGNGDATSDQIARATSLLRDLDGIRYVHDLSRRYVTQALENLAELPPSPNKALLEQWADYLIDRQF